MDEKCILNPERDCLGLMKAEAVEKRLDVLEKRNTESHERLFGRLESLEKQDVIQGEQYKNIMTNLSELKSDSKEVISKLTPITHRVESLERASEEISTYVDAQKEKPAKRWDGLIEKVIGLVAAAAVGYVLAQLGLQ